MFGACLFFVYLCGVKLKTSLKSMQKLTAKEEEVMELMWQLPHHKEHSR